MTVVERENKDLMLGDLVRKIGDRVLRPANVRLTRAGVKPEWVYVPGLAFAAASCATFWTGHLWLGLALLVLHGMFDYLDGGLRRALGDGSQPPRWLGMSAHAAVDKVSELLLFAGLGGGGWAGWPLVVAAAASSVAITLLGQGAKRWLDVDPGRVLFERADRLFALLVAGAFRAFGTALTLVCALNGFVLLQRAAQIWRVVRTGNRTS